MRAISSDSYRRLVADASAVPRPTPLGGMPTVVTFAALGVTAIGLAALSLLGTWNLTTWWSALSDRAPISVAVTVAVVLGWQLQLTHTALGALELVRTGDSQVGQARRTLVLAAGSIACLAWFTVTVLLPGV